MSGYQPLVILAAEAARFPLVTLLKMDDAQPDVQIPLLNVDRAQALLAPPAVLPQEPRQEQAVAAPPASNQPAPAPQQATELEVIYSCHLLSVYAAYFPFAGIYVAFVTALVSCCVGPSPISQISSRF